jgi:CBS domain-containing protein
MTAKDIMCRDVRTVSQDETVAAAARLMHDAPHGALPVVGADGKVVGIIDRATLLRLCLLRYAEDLGDLAFLPPDFSAFETRVGTIARTLVRDVMRPCDVCVAEDTPLVELAALIVLKRVDDVPVLRAARVVGIVGLQDLVDEIVWPHLKHGEDR